MITQLLTFCWQQSQLPQRRVSLTKPLTFDPQNLKDLPLIQTPRVSPSGGCHSAVTFPTITQTNLLTY